MVKLKGKQYKIDFNKNKKLDKEDFKILAKIKKVAKALKKASALHKKQSKIIEKHIKEMKNGGSKKRYG